MQDLSVRCLLMKYLLDFTLDLRNQNQLAQHGREDLIVKENSFTANQGPSATLLAFVLGMCKIFLGS